MTDHSFEFTRSITRRPACSVVDGLRAKDHGTPDFDQMLKDHAHYVATLSMYFISHFDTFFR
jgi:dimethylargininase